METVDRPLSGTQVGKVEADMFCGACGYNLFTLDVIRDERLGIAVVQCPECGKYHPAGHATGAGRVWLNRLAALLISMWVVSLAVGVVGFGFLCGSLDVGKIEAFTQYRELTVAVPDRFGNLRDWYQGPSVAANAEDWYLMLLGDSLFNAGSLLLGFLAGTGVACFLLHLKRWWALCLGFLPLLAVAIVSLGYFEDRDRYMSGMTGWFAWRLGLMFSLQFLGIALGARFGRPVVRGILRVAVSRRLLQYVRALWEVDGMAAPGMKEKSEAS